MVLEQFGYGFGIAGFMVYLIYIAEGASKTSHYALATGFMALGMMLPGLVSGYIQEWLGYDGFFIWVVIGALPAIFILKYLKYPADYGKKGRIQKLDFIDYPTAAKSLSLKEKVGQFFMPAAFINDSEEEILKLQDLISKHHIGGLCFFHSRASAATNYEGKKEVVYNEDSYRVLKNLIERYQQVAKYPLLISIDAEWGLAMRVENTPQYPYAITLGAIDNHDEAITEVGKNIANDCKQAGIHWNFTPVADINSNPENPVIGYRSFGSDKHNVANKAIALAKGLQSVGILNSAKHFPGHGDTATDSHLGLPLINKSKDELLDNELYPFKHLIQNGIDSIMVGHLAVPSLAGGSMEPSSISEKIIKGVLREEMGFQGVVVSDALNMHAVSKMFLIRVI